MFTFYSCRALVSSNVMRVYRCIVQPKRKRNMDIVRFGDEINEANLQQYTPCSNNK